MFQMQSDPQLTNINPWDSSRSGFLRKLKIVLPVPGAVVFPDNKNVGRIDFKGSHDDLLLIKQRL